MTDTQPERTTTIYGKDINVTSEAGLNVFLAYVRECENRFEGLRQNPSRRDVVVDTRVFSYLQSKEGSPYFPFDNAPGIEPADAHKWEDRRLHAIHSGLSNQHFDERTEDDVGLHGPDMDSFTQDCYRLANIRRAAVRGEEHADEITAELGDLVEPIGQTSNDVPLRFKRLAATLKTPVFRVQQYVAYTK